MNFGARPHPRRARGWVMGLALTKSENSLNIVRLFA